VAIKVLPEMFAADADRLARFRREARLLASLNHPNIAAIHGLHEANDVRFIAMELVPGEDLASRLERGPLPVDDALDCGRRIAEALESAHDNGVIHRDLKPANIKLAEDGTIKVLDFGLAKAMEPDRAPADPAMSPTLTSAGSIAGTILGTAAYMSPEQARGKPVDRRSDVWAFGCVLYEVLTGRPAFPGETVTDILARVVQSEPDYEMLPAQTPVGARRLLQRCLRKDASRRLRDIGDARLEIEEAGSEESQVHEPVPPSGADSTEAQRTWLRLLPWALAVVLGAWLVATHLGGESTPGPVMRFAIPAPEGYGLGEFSVSPDGRNVVLVATEQQGARQLWLRPLDTDDPRPLPGTEGAMFPFWSPDSRSIGFFARGKLSRVDLAAETTRAIVDAPNGRGGAWSPDGTIVFTPAGEDGLFTVPATGGEAKPLTTLEAGEATHRFPHFLADGNRFTYIAQGPGGTPSHAYVAALDAADDREWLFDSETEAYTPPGYLLHVQDRVLVARHFDHERLEQISEPVPLARGVIAGYPRNARGSFSVSANGVLGYRIAPPAEAQLVWFDRSGERLETVTPPGEYESAVLSPNDRNVAFIRREPPLTGDRELWIADLERGTSTRFVTDLGENVNAAWSPDGKGLVYATNRLIRRKLLGRGGDPETLMEAQSAGDPSVPSWPGRLNVAPDGTFVVFESWDSARDWDIWMLPLEGDRVPRLLVKGEGQQLIGQISPDGRYLVYESDESGARGIFVQSLDSTEGKWIVSTSGGISPHWGSDGDELFYIAPDGRLMVVEVRTTGDLEFGSPRALFQAPAGLTSSFTDLSVVPLLVGCDGKRFLFVVPTGEPRAPKMNVVVNWEDAF
jgi:Tol biopolymer transport system component